MKRCKITCLILTLLTSLSLMGCNDHRAEYKQRIQQDNDNINPSGHKAICLSVGDIPKNGYPYTIKYMEGEKDPNATWDPIFWNKDLNLKLSLYAKEGLFTEELVGEDHGKPLYRYQLTPEGRKYAEWWSGSGSETTYFCFGKVVVDTINDTMNIGANSRRIWYSYHYENIPDWIKNKDLYLLYPTLHGERAVIGQQMNSSNDYYLYNDQLDRLTQISASGRHTL